MKPTVVPQCLVCEPLLLVVSPARISPFHLSRAMAHDHPDAHKQYGIRLSEDTMKLVSRIQHFRQRTNQPMTLSLIVEDAIQCHYARLVSEGAIPDD